ncbi:hypothetical protein BsWGS_21462 [Bradybaena similaris]
MDTRLLAAWLLLCQLWTLYKPCSTSPDLLITRIAIGDVFDEDSSRAEATPGVTSPTQLPDSTPEGSSSPGEQHGVSGDAAYSHRHDRCCQHEYAGRHHGRMMGYENGHMMGRYNGHMEGRLNRRVMGRRGEDTMGHHIEMGRWSDSMYDRDQMQGGSEDGTKRVDRSGSNHEGFRGMMGNGHFDMMEGRYGMSDGVDYTRGPRHREHRRRHGQHIPDKNDD